MEASRQIWLVNLGADGEIIWTAQLKHPLEGVWTDVQFRDGVLETYNAAGFRDIVDYDTGMIRTRTFVK